MIDYYQGRYQFWNTLFRVHGSALYRALIPSLCSTGILILLHWTAAEPSSEDDARWFSHPYPIACMMVAFTFLLTFKCSFSYNRYWESCIAVHQMHSKWLDVAMNLAAFHLQSEKYSHIVPPAFGQHPHINQIVRKRQRIKPVPTPKDIEDMMTEDNNLNRRRNSSSSSFLQTENIKKEHLRRYSINDSKANNRLNSLAVGVFQSFSESPVATSPRKTIRRQTIKAQTDLSGGMGNTLGPSLFLQETSHLFSLLSAVAFATLRKDVETAESPLKHYTPGSPWPPVDPDERGAGLHNEFHKNSRFFTALRYLLVGQRSPRERTVYNACRPLAVLGGVSDAEIEVLQRARGPLAKTALCSMWVEEFITREFLNGSLGKVQAPIISRLYQFLSDGLVGYNQARNVAYVPFPFPHFQLTTFFLVVVSGMMPVLMLTYVPQIMVAAVLNTVTVGCFYGLWLVAKELEQPFRNVPNDIPLNNFQAQFNEALVCMFAGYHPESWWDIEEEVSQSKLSSDDGSDSAKL